MLSNVKIMEAVYTAMAHQAGSGSGARVVSRNEIRMAVNELGGDEDDVVRAMLASMDLQSARRA